MTHSDYRDKALMVIEELFPNMSIDAQKAFAALVAEFMWNLDNIAG